jgi:hypothetical protein
VSRKSLFSAITFGFLAVATTGCCGDAPKPTESKAPQSAANTSPTTNTAVNTQPLVQEAGKKAEGAAAEKPTDAVVAGLLPASDSESVVRSTMKGRTDPFSGLVLQLKPPELLKLLQHHR